MECDSILDKSSQPSYAPSDLIIDSESTDESSSGMSDGSLDEERRIKEELKLAKAQRKAADLLAREFAFKKKLIEHQGSNASQSSHGSNDRSRTRIYPDHRGGTQRFDLATPPPDGLFGSSLLDLTPPAALSSGHLAYAFPGCWRQLVE